jgi:hypothetical protein
MALSNRTVTVDGTGRSRSASPTLAAGGPSCRSTAVRARPRWLNATVLNIALPELPASLHATTGQLQWKEWK